MRHFLSISLLLAHASLPGATAAPELSKPVLEGPAVTPLEWNSRSPRFADLNGDQLPDLAVINNSEGKIDFLLRKGEPSTRRTVGNESSKAKWEPELDDGWFERRFMVIEQTAFDLGLSDFNRDGRIDLALTGNRDALAIYLQDEEGEFEQAWTFDEFSPKQRGRTLHIEDLNRDNQPDLIALGREKILILLNSKDGLDFKITEFFVEENAAWSLLTPDLNGDGWPDLLYYHSNQNANFLAVRLQTAGGVFGPEIPIEFSSAIYARLPKDKNGRPHFIYSEGRTGQVKDFSLSQESYTESHAFKNIQAYTYPLNSNIRDAALYTWGDLNGDNRTDLVIGDPEGAQIQVFLQDKTGLFSTQKNFPAFAYLNGVSVLKHPVTRDPVIFQISKEERMAGISKMTQDGDLPFPTLLPLEGEPVALLSNHEAGQGFQGLLLVEKIKREYHLTEYKLNETGDWRAQRLELKNHKNDPRGLMLAYLEKNTPFLVVLGQREESLFFKQSETGWTEVAKDAALRKTLLFDLAPDRINFSDSDGDGIDELFVADTGFLRKISYQPEKDDFVILDQFNTPKRKQDAHLPIPYSRADTDGIVYFDPKDDHLYWTGKDRVSSLQGNKQKELPPINPVIGRHIGMGKGRSALLVGGDKRFYLLPDTGERWKIDYGNAFYEPQTKEVRHAFLFATNRVPGDETQVIGIDPNAHVLEMFNYAASEDWIHQLEFTIFDQTSQRGGQQINYQPTDAGIHDLNNDGKEDLVLLVHDRLLIYY